MSTLTRKRAKKFIKNCGCDLSECCYYCAQKRCKSQPYNSKGGFKEDYEYVGKKLPKKKKA